MRLIDADAAIIAVSDQDIGMLTPWDMGRNSGLNFAIKKIKELPTIQPEHAITLSWIEEYIERLCNVPGIYSELRVSIINKMIDEWNKEQKGR